MCGFYLESASCAFNALSTGLPALGGGGCPFPGTCGDSRWVTSSPPGVTVRPPHLQSRLFPDFSCSAPVGPKAGNLGPVPVTQAPRLGKPVPGTSPTRGQSQLQKEVWTEAEPYVEKNVKRQNSTNVYYISKV